MNQTELTFIFLGIAALLLIRNILRPDIVALMLLLSLGLTGRLTPREMFSGFSRSSFLLSSTKIVVSFLLWDAGLGGLGRLDFVAVGLPLALLALPLFWLPRVLPI